MLEPVGLHVGLPDKVADAITATGTARVKPFSAISPPGPRTVSLTQVGATVLGGNIEASADGGTTWVVLQAFDLIANKVINITIVPGMIYRTNVTTLTTTPADIFATMS